MTYVKGKVALVTGGVSGIGLGITKHLLLNGAKGVAIADISEENGNLVETALQKQYGDKIIFIRTDVTKEEDFINAFEKTIQTFKTIDIVCNNAGTSDEIEWEKMVAVNLTSVLRGTYLALDTYLPKHKTGEEAVIVNTASILGINTSPGALTYCSTKHGVVGLGKTLADEERYKKSRIRVVTICPGLVDTPLLKNARMKDNVISKILSLSEQISSPDKVGEDFIQIINESRNGSVWVVENDEKPYEVEFLDRVQMRKK